MTATQASFINGIQGNLSDCMKILKVNTDPAIYAQVEPMLILSYGMLNQLKNDNQTTAKKILENLREQIESFDLEMEEPEQILFGDWAETLAKALDLMQ